MKWAPTEGLLLLLLLQKALTPVLGSHRTFRKSKVANHLPRKRASDHCCTTHIPFRSLWTPVAFIYLFLNRFLLEQSRFTMLCQLSLHGAVYGCTRVPPFMGLLPTQVVRELSRVPCVYGGFSSVTCFMCSPACVSPSLPTHPPPPAPLVTLVCCLHLKLPSFKVVWIPEQKRGHTSS